MPRTHPIRALTAALLTLAAILAPAPSLRAQTAVTAASTTTSWPAPDRLRISEFAPGIEFCTLPYEQARQKAKRECKLFVVIAIEPGTPEAAIAERRLLRNPTLAFFLKWHAVTVKVTGSCVSFTVYKDDEVLGSIGCMKDRLSPQIDAVIASLPAAQLDGLRGAARPTPGAAGALFTVDYALEKIRAVDPVWYALHERRNPPPQPPPLPPPFHLQDDGRAEVIGEGEDPPADEGAGLALTLERLEAARRAARVGDLYRATGLYTWLWERAAELDPAFAAARRSFLAAEIADLAFRRDGCRERFNAIRAAHARRLLWATYDDFHEWCVLNALCGDEALTVEWFDPLINDEQEAAMLPRADKAAYELLLARESFGNPLELGDDPVAKVRRIAAARTQPCPRQADPQDWARFQSFADTLLLHEACRLHAACLTAGRDADAHAIASILLAASDTPITRRALALTALAAGHPRPEHIDLLKAIPQPHDPATTTLLTRLTTALQSPHDEPRTQ